MFEETPPGSNLHSSVILVANPRALNNALEALGFSEDDDRVIEHAGRLGFHTCNHSDDMDDFFALLGEIVRAGESYEIHTRVELDGETALFQTLKRDAPAAAAIVDVSDADAPPAVETPAKPARFDLDTAAGRSGFLKAVKGLKADAAFVEIRPAAGGGADAHVRRKSPRETVAVACAADRSRLADLVRQTLPNVMVSIAGGGR